MQGGERDSQEESSSAALHRAMALAVDRLNEEKERLPCLGAGDTDAEEGSARAMLGHRRRIALDVLFVCWGLGTWLGVNGLFVQLPLLVERLPEGWALPSSMALAVQIANVGLLLYAVFKRLIPKGSDSPYIYGLLVIGAASLTLNAFLYDRTTPVGGSDRSIAFLTLTFCAALVGCTSSVLFYPYLRHFRDVYLATYLVGEGLSGFVPSLIALIQGVGGEPECIDGVAHYDSPRFDTTVFMLILGGLGALSLISFAAVDKGGWFEEERVAPSAIAKDTEAQPRVDIFKGAWAAVLILMFVINALTNGVLPSVQSYSCMPYGARAYHLAATLSSMANPVTCLAGVWLSPAPWQLLVTILTVTLAPLCYIMSTALLSPTPPLHGDTAGVAIIVISWVWTSSILSYARMWMYGWARRGGARGMRAVGAVTQVGSALGSLLLFLLVNYTSLFEDAPTCPPVDPFIANVTLPQTVALIL